MSEAASTTDEYLDVENAFWERMEFQKNSPRRWIHEKLIRRLRENALSENFTRCQYEQAIDEATEVLDHILFAMKANWKDAPRDKIWYSPNFSLVDRPNEWTDSSPIDPDELDRVTSSYLRKPWMQLNNIDWYILNSFIYDEYMRLLENFKSGTALGKVNWAYVLSDGKYMRTLWYQLLLSFSKFFLRWLFPPAIIALLYFYFELRQTAIVLGALYLVYVAVRLIFLPKRLAQKRSLKKKALDIENKLQKLAQLYQSTNSNTINPTRLREKLVSVENEGIVLRPAVYSIVDRAISRDPAVFTLDHDG
jgi:hypothetical protein